MADVNDDNFDADPDGKPPTTFVEGDKHALSALRAAVAASRGRRVTRVSWRRRARQFFTRDRMRDFATTLALVLPLTVLIWVWAEREQVQTARRTFYITVRTVDPSKTLTVVDDPRVGAAGDAVDIGGERRVAVEVSLNGPRSGLDTLADVISKDPEKVYLSLDVSDAPDVGRTYDVPLQPLIEQQKLFNELGVSIEKMTPERVRVEVDRMAERELPIRLPADLANVVQLVHADPATVKVHGPERDIVRLGSAGTLIAELDLARDGPEITNARPSAPFSIDATLKPIAGEGLAFDAPSKIRVSLQVSAEQEDVLASMPVNLSGPMAIVGRVRTETPSLTNVRISGRPDVIRRLKEGRGDMPYAEIKVTIDDIGKRGRRSPVFRDLPPGVRVVEGSVPDIAFDATDGAAGNP